MLKKILDSKIYRIIMCLVECLFLINIGIMFYKGEFGENYPVNWTFFWINVIVIVLLFCFDCVINACVGKMIYVSVRKETGFQATKYCYISLGVSCGISIVMWLLKIIPNVNGEGNTFSFLVSLLLISLTVFCIFFFMIIMFLINNKIVLSKEEFEKENSSDKNKKNNSNKNNLLKF